MWYHFAISMILRPKMKKTVFVQDAVPFPDFGDFSKKFCCLNHAVPFLDFGHFFPENSWFESCGTFLRISRFWGLKLEGNLCMNHAVPFCRFPNFKV